MRLAAQAKGGFYPTPEKVVDFIATLIRAPAGYYYRNREVIRILDPCCGAGGRWPSWENGLPRTTPCP